MLASVINDFAKSYLRDDLQWVRQSVVDRLDGLSEYDVRRPLTSTGTNLLGLFKHLTLTDAVYLGDIFSRPHPDPHSRFDDPGYRNRNSLWVTAEESRAAIIAGYQQVWQHSDTTIAELPIDATGYVPWWPQPEGKLFNVMVHVLTETNRHAGHADICVSNYRKRTSRDRVPAGAGLDALQRPPGRPDPRSTVVHLLEVAAVHPGATSAKWGPGDVRCRT